MLKELNYGEAAWAELKRFIMFASHHYYPSGGMNDAKVTADTLAEILTWHVDQSYAFDYDEWHILDCQTMKVVKEG